MPAERYLRLRAEVAGVVGASLLASESLRGRGQERGLRVSEFGGDGQHVAVVEGGGVQNDTGGISAVRGVGKGGVSHYLGLRRIRRHDRRNAGHPPAIPRPVPGRPPSGRRWSPRGPESERQIELSGAVLAGMPGGGQASASPAPDLGDHGLHGEASVAPALLSGRDVEAPESGAEVGTVAGPVDVEEGHEEPDDLVAVADEPGPGDAGVNVRFGERLHHGCHRVFLVGADLQADGGLEVVRGDLLQVQRNGHPRTLCRDGKLSVPE